MCQKLKVNKYPTSNPNPRSLKTSTSKMRFIPLVFNIRVLTQKSRSQEKPKIQHPAFTLWVKAKNQQESKPVEMYNQCSFACKRSLENRKSILLGIVKSHPEKPSRKLVKITTPAIGGSFFMLTKSLFKNNLQKS